MLLGLHSAHDPVASSLAAAAAPGGRRGGGRRAPGWGRRASSGGGRLRGGGGGVETSSLNIQVAPAASQHYPAQPGHCRPVLHSPEAPGPTSPV